MFLQRASEPPLGRLAERVGGAVRNVSALLGRSPTAPAWIADVAGIIGDLETLNRLTEEDFLAVGERMMGFLSAARDIRADFGRLAEFISGESGERACQALATVLNRSVEMQERVERTSHTLAALRHNAEKIQRLFSGFDDVVLSFQVVATLGQIETARLGSSQADLGHFAVEVRSCGAKIQGRVGHALEAATALEERIDRIINYVSAQDTQQLEALPSLLCTVRGALEAFGLRQDEATATSARLANEFASFSEALNGLVAALQFHDITRQRIEHVIDSLKLILSNAGSSRRASRPKPEETAVIELQHRQLLGAGEAFATSVQRVKRDLDEIATRGRAMGQETIALLGSTAEDQQSSFFNQMESCFAEVRAGVSKCAALDEETAHAVAELEHVVASLATCVQDLGAITLEINHLAINSTIRAEHLGPVGAPLSVVAGALQTLHADARDRQGETKRVIAAFDGELLSMNPVASPDPAGGARSDSTGMVDELRTRIEDLHASDAGSQTCRSRISKAAAQLSRDVQAASDSFNIGALVEETLARCCGALQKISVEAGPGAIAPNFRLEHLAAQYTMSAERDVHEMATAATTPEPSPQEPATTAESAGGGLGENVELF